MFYFFFNDTATTEIYTLSLHDALPICNGSPTLRHRRRPRSRQQQTNDSRDRHAYRHGGGPGLQPRDRKSTRLNSSHLGISYAVFCLKKKKKKIHKVHKTIKA